jgi:hypothetical protein
VNVLFEMWNCSLMSATAGLENGEGGRGVWVD